MRHPANSATRTGRSSAWLERLVWDQEAGGSNPPAPTNFPIRTADQYVKRVTPIPR